MSHRAKGFSLIELLVTVSLVGILAAIAIPSFTSVIQNSKADTEISDLQRALNYARLEAINRGVSTQVLPVSGTAWNSELMVVASATPTADKALRRIAAMSSGAAIAMVPNVTLIEFNNLGGPVSLTAPLVVTYTLGTTTKTINVCLNGRIVLGGSCT
ncbi:MAG TPA: GspH/FimT family pseudopilin [Pseudomonas sp.]|jgi:type IV fimbrial biogenesis protein FimU|uniref:GspH/FimT family pseudopilin n=1 Tax=Pseudomonas sp. TaxID=306 RepID=UPI002EDB768F